MLTVEQRKEVERLAREWIEKRDDWHSAGSERQIDAAAWNLLSAEVGFLSFLDSITERAP